MRMGKWAWLLLVVSSAVGRMQGFLGRARQQQQLHSFQQRQHDREPGCERHLDHYRDAVEFVYGDGVADLLGYERTYGRDKSDDVQPFSDFGHDQQHDGANVDADGNHDFLDDRGKLTTSR